MCCLSSCIAKCCLSLCNSLIVIVGVALAAIGGILLWGQPVVQTIIGSVLEALLSLTNLQANVMNLNAFSLISDFATLLFVFGLVLILIGSLGYVSACCSCCKCCAVAYVLVLTLLLLAEIVVTVVYFAMQPQFSVLVKHYLFELIQEYYVDIWQLNNNFNIVAFVMNLVMVDLQCCGVYNYTDYQSSVLWNRTQTYNATYNIAMVTPLACCVMTSDTSFQAVDSNCTASPNFENSYIDYNCYTVMTDTIGKFLYAIVGTLGGLALLLLLPIALTCCLCLSTASVTPV